MPLVPTFDMAAADPEDFGLDFDDLPDFMNQEGRPVGPGPSVEPGQDEAWRCVQCDSDHLLFDYLGWWRCGDCGCFRQYRTDRPTTRPAAHGQGQWHYVPAGDWPPEAAPNPQPSPGDPVATSGRPAAARRRRRQRRHRGGPPSGDGASERSEQPESETLRCRSGTLPRLRGALGATTLILDGPREYLYSKLTAEETSPNDYPILRYLDLSLTTRVT